MTSTATEPITYGSQRLAELIEKIGEGSLERERTGERPFAVIDLIKQSGLGALRVPREEGGGGATLRDLFATVIAIATADVNVAHILRGHFAHIEERLRLDSELRQKGIDLALSGKLIGNASTEIGSTRPVVSRGRPGSPATATTICSTVRSSSPPARCTPTTPRCWPVIPPAPP